MFKDAALESHLKKSSSIGVRSLVVAEWNLNDIENIKDYGNYRYRSADTESIYSSIPSQYQEIDSMDAYTGALESEDLVSNVVDPNNEPLFFKTLDKRRSIYYDLKECFEPFRPRSGINKPLFFSNSYIDNVSSARRPRYYIASRKDKFKYWTSFKTETVTNNVNGKNVQTLSQFGISNSEPIDPVTNAGYRIDDAAPFVVYKKELPANRIVVKIQTNLADPEAAIPSIRRKNDSILEDPFLNIENSTVPAKWDLEYLDEDNNWVTAISFNEDSTRIDGTRIFDWDGHVELYYGLRIDRRFKPAFNFVEYLLNEEQLPSDPAFGEAYIIGASETEPGFLYIWDSSQSEAQWYVTQVVYEFDLYESNDTKKIGLISELTNPKTTIFNGQKIYRDFVFVKGLRMVVKSMYGPGKTFDLIEMSPRLTADVTEYTASYEINKSLSNQSFGIPVGGLSADNGQIVLSNHDSAFSEENSLVEDKGSILAKVLIEDNRFFSLLKPNIKFNFYEAITRVNDNGLQFDKYVPIKTMYSENFPLSAGGTKEINLELRDNFFRLENSIAPSIFLKNIPLTTAVAIMLDNIGFSNYIFYNEVGGENFDPVIDYFFVEPNVTVAEVLQRLAVATQSAMFFDEYNNFVIMVKEYLLPNQNDREIDWTMFGQVSSTSTTNFDPQIRVANGDYALPNIVDVRNTETFIVNDGKIDYKVRYIQKSPGSVKQESYVHEDRTYISKPVLLWEVGNQENTKTINEKAKEGGYALGAVPLNTSLTSMVPEVVNNQIINNIIDVGENIYWLPRFQGYFYAGGEIIKFDAVEYNISGTGKKWITSNQEYQKYFAKLPFNGKIFPTGKIRIYTEPYYQEVQDTSLVGILGLERGVLPLNGPVKTHGRGQFGTEVVAHQAGVSTEWTGTSNLRGVATSSEYLFNTIPSVIRKNDSFRREIFPQYYAENSSQGIPKTGLKVPVILNNSNLNYGSDNTTARKSTRKGTIVNFMRAGVPAENSNNVASSTSVGTVQASALVFTGPTFSGSGSAVAARDFLSIVYKDLGPQELSNNTTTSPAYRHFGTRMRIVGKVETNGNSQTPTNAMPYFTVENSALSSQTKLSGGSGGIGVLLNKETNQGYYFEIASLTSDNLEQFVLTNDATGEIETTVHNLIFYKLTPGKVNNKNVSLPVKLWGGLTNILVDEGTFVGMDRVENVEYPTVYDLAVEYEKVGKNLKFYLYLNNKLIATVYDDAPLSGVGSSIGLFVRGSSKCMFENVYALNNILSTQMSKSILENNESVFDNNITGSEAVRKYAMSGIVNSTYLSSLNTNGTRAYNLYFEEFGTIMRECDYFNIQYDKAYPAFLAFLAPTFSNEKNYVTSKFYASSYGAEFLIFNTTDKAIRLDETTGNYLRIVGVTFTQDTSYSLTVDEYFNKVSNFADPIRVDRVLRSPVIQRRIFEDVLSSRSKYGKKNFALQSDYIQNQDQANDLMEWLISKTLRPRKVVILESFATQHLQLGDIINIDYRLPDNYDFVDKNKKFVISEIAYNRLEGGPTMTIKGVEI